MFSSLNLALSFRLLYPFHKVHERWIGSEAASRRRLKSMWQVYNGSSNMMMWMRLELVTINSQGLEVSHYSEQIVCRLIQQLNFLPIGSYIKWIINFIIFAVDVWNLAPGEDSRDVDGTHAIGYPILFMDQVSTDEYWVQAVLHPYVEYNRSDGWNLLLPKFTTFESDGGVFTAPGTLYSAARLTTFDPLTSSIDWTLTLREPEQPEVNEPHELLKHVTFRSPMLSNFWGTDVYL
ncbi:hypothetical protein PsorP6_010020 [Peronosclerospora sorghi]|uniref:Uncharacterized protein n=1 Tax=Peronosclerospora sorghi TaxID=230839 RepID=A0ACC0VXR6_9STRA|nr:hypothetical protein PsorP6_010020 [Peronosclerospora sorghi]